MSRTLTAAFAVVVLLLGFAMPMVVPAASAGSNRENIEKNVPLLSTATAFTVDFSHSTIIFKIRHFDVSNFYGRVNAPKGSFTIDAANPAASSLKITMEIKNMDTGNEGRNRFILSPDFFSVREHPTATFRSTSFEKIDDATFTVTGDFTLRGVTKPVTVKLFDYTEKQTTKFGYRGGFEAHFTIKRSDFGMDRMIEERLLGDEVAIIASIEGVKAEG